MSDVRFHFGEYKGELVDDVPRDYLVWVAGYPRSARHPNGFEFGDARLQLAVMARCEREGIDWEAKRSGGSERFLPRGQHKALYEAYLLSDTWRELRAEFIRARGGECQRCGVRVPMPRRCTCGCYTLMEKGTEVHHLHYDTLGEERLEDVEVLCCECHGAESREAPRIEKSSTAGREGFDVVQDGKVRKLVPGVGIVDPPAAPRSTVAGQENGVLLGTRLVALPWEEGARTAVLGDFSELLGFRVDRVVWVRDEAFRLDRPVYVDGEGERRWFDPDRVEDFDHFNAVVCRGRLREKWRPSWTRAVDGLRVVTQIREYEDVMKACERKGLPRLPPAAYELEAGD